MTLPDNRQALSKERIGQLLVRAYPDSLAEFDGENLRWRDGSVMPIASDKAECAAVSSTDTPSIIAQFASPYPLHDDYVFAEHQSSDPGRARNTPFFQRMYGADQAAVERNLVEIRWMPRLCNKRILVTRVNGVDRKLVQVSEELDRLPRSLRKYITHIGGSYNWRAIEGSDQLSPHAFGIAIDINVAYGNYWKWDLGIRGEKIFRNRIPREIIETFERHGFIWGGKWKHYDTMHFEYRPELIMATDPTFGKPRILLLSRETAMYGAQRQLLYLLKGLANDRYRPFVVHGEAESASPPMANDEGITHLYLRMRPWRKISNAINRYVDAFRLLELARRENVQLVHCSYQWLLPYAQFVGRRLNIPVVLHIRRPNNPPDKLRRLGCNDCDALIAVSARIKRELVSAGMPENKVHLIPDAVDLSSFNDQAPDSLRRELGIGEHVLFGLVGRVNKSKRQLDFVRAARKFLDKGHDARFVLVGRIDDQDYWREVETFIATNDLASRVFAIGHRDDAASAIASLDVLVSLAGGSVMYEAMAIGRTVISAGFTKPEDSTHLIDGMTGLVTDSRDDDVLVGLMERAYLDRGLRDRLGSAAREWANSHFSTAALVDATEQVYEKLLASHRETAVPA